MTKENYNRATKILEQIKTSENLKEDIQKQYNSFKDTTYTKLLEVLNKCNEVVSVLIEIDKEKFKEL